MKSYQDLEVWKKGMDLAQQIYRLTSSFPREELFGMTSQLRRSASSIPANIAEGWGRNTNKEFNRYLNIANGSLRETETHLILAVRVNLCKQEQINPILELSTVLSKQILSLQRSISANDN